MEDFWYAPARARRGATFRFPPDPGTRLVGMQLYSRTRTRMPGQIPPRAISHCLPPSLLLSILCWSYCRVVALVYCAGLRHELSNLDAAAAKAFNHDIFLPSWRAVMVTCFAGLLWRCEKLCILGDTINLEVNRNGEWLMQKSKQHFMIYVCCIVLHF